MPSIDIEFHAVNKNLWFAHVSSLFTFSSGHSAREHLVNRLFDGPAWLFVRGAASTFILLP